VFRVARASECAARRAAIASAEASGASSAALLDGYIAGSSLKGGSDGDETRATTSADGTAPRRSGRSAPLPPPAHLRLDAETTSHALAIAASEACGLKENFGTMVKPLHAGLAARNGVLAALLAKRA